MIEPFRPIVDLHVAKIRPADDAAQLSPSNKADLIALLNIDVRTPRGVMAALSAIEHSVEALARLYEPAHAPQRPHARARRAIPLGRRTATDDVLSNATNGDSGDAEVDSASTLEWPELIGLTPHRREM